MQHRQRYYLLQTPRRTVSVCGLIDVPHVLVLLTTHFSPNQAEPCTSCRGVLTRVDMWTFSSITPMLDRRARAWAQAGCRTWASRKLDGRVGC